MAKLREPMNLLQKRTILQNRELTSIRREIRSIRKETGKIPDALKNRVTEIKYKKRLPGPYNRAIVAGEAPWK